MIAYFSMEVGLESDLPTYAGGLGILAGDTLKAAADLGLPVVGVTLLHRAGYFRQRLDPHGVQEEEPVKWSPVDRLEEAPASARIALEGSDVAIRAWRFDVRGVGGHLVPVFFLDTDLPENAPGHRAIAGALYGGGPADRLRQEAVLGLGGIAMLEALGLKAVATHHLNEGHSALLALALLERRANGTTGVDDRDVAAVRARCVFTTHTPVAAGHDRFPTDLAREILGDRRARLLTAAGCLGEEGLDMTRLALRFSRHANAVSMRHGEVARAMFPDATIHAITNGVHAATWTSPAFAELFDRHLPGWRGRTALLRHALGIPLEELRAAHAGARAALVADVARRTGRTLDPERFTVGFARRASAYKRADLLVSNLDRLAALGPLQILYAGKAHPRDETGKEVVRRVFEAASRLPDSVRLVWLEDYDMEFAARLVAGVDLWLNTPRRPLEASGTSGMKAALNGVPSLSVLDGWWVEGHVEGVTGWSIEADDPDGEPDDAREAAALYDRMEETILPLFRDRPDDWARVMRSTIALNGSWFTAERMVHQYARTAWAAPGGTEALRAAEMAGAPGD